MLKIQIITDNINGLGVNIMNSKALISGLILILAGILVEIIVLIPMTVYLINGVVTGNGTPYSGTLAEMSNYWFSIPDPNSGLMWMFVCHLVIYATIATGLILLSRSRE